HAGHADGAARRAEPVNEQKTGLIKSGTPIPPRDGGIGQQAYFITSTRLSGHFRTLQAWL
ncbi:hypothetical protein, partial [Pantoea brenneri]|uniref:hypothetical protein n=1 Tax=Pantoea brenneri TaxID=472694 RepID=UPI00197E6E31